MPACLCPHLEMHYEVTEQADWQELWSRNPYMGALACLHTTSLSMRLRKNSVKLTENIYTVSIVGIPSLSLITSNHAPKLVFRVFDN